MSSNAPVSAPDLSKEAQVGKTKKAKPVAVKKAKPVKKAKAEKKPRAKKSGVEKVDLKEAVKLRKTGMGFWDIGKKFGVTGPTVWKLLKENAPELTGKKGRAMKEKIREAEADTESK